MQNSQNIKTTDQENNTKFHYGKFLEPALVIAFLTATTYFIGWIYANEYFKRLGIQHESLNFSTTFYLTKSFIPLMLIFIFGLFFTDIFKSTHSTNSYAFRANIPILILASLPFNLFPKTESNMNFYYGLFASSILLILYIFLSVRKINLIIVTLNILKRAELLGFILILMIFILAAALLGSYHAKKLGEGTLSDVIGIEFKTKRTFTEIDNKKLILILHNEGKYFVVEKQNPLPEYPNVFILPDEQVEFAIMKRIN